MLGWGFATEEVCVRGGPHVSKAGNEKGLGGLKNKRVSKRTTVMRAIQPTVDQAALGSEDKAYPLSPFTQRRGGAHMKLGWGCRATTWRLRVMS